MPARLGKKISTVAARAGNRITHVFGRGKIDSFWAERRMRKHVQAVHGRDPRKWPEHEGLRGIHQQSPEVRKRMERDIREKIFSGAGVSERALMETIREMQGDGFTRQEVAERLVERVMRERKFNRQDALQAAKQACDKIMESISVFREETGEKEQKADSRNPVERIRGSAIDFTGQVTAELRVPFELIAMELKKMG